MTSATQQKSSDADGEPVRLNGPIGELAHALGVGTRDERSRAVVFDQAQLSEAKSVLATLAEEHAQRWIDLSALQTALDEVVADDLDDGCSHEDAFESEDVWERLRRAHAALMACDLDYEDDDEDPEFSRPTLTLIKGGTS